MTKDTGTVAQLSFGELKTVRMLRGRAWEMALRHRRVVRRLFGDSHCREEALFNDMRHEMPGGWELSLRVVVARQAKRLRAMRRSAA